MKRVLFLLLLPCVSQAKPNIVFVLADDLGASELGCCGHQFNETPNLDRLAKEGMRFTHAYAAAPVCSPYRAALLTGQHPARIGIVDYLRPNSANALSTDHVTLPEMLKAQGYVTAMIGKWHLTGYKFHNAEHEIKPRDHGFDWDFAREVKGVGNGANFWPYVFRKQPIRWIDIPKQRLGKDEFLVDRMNREAVDFIERNKDRPFFLYLSHYAPHSILNGKPNLVAKYRKKHKPGKSSRERCYLCQDQGHKGDALNHWARDHNPHLAAMLESIDDGIGMIRKKLDQLGLAKNTIFIFTSDNGGETNVTSNAPLRGGKSQLYEGGIRVPLIIRWPDSIPAGSVCPHPTMNVDFYPTLLEAANIQPEKRHLLDGVSTLAMWKDPKQKGKRETLYWHYPLDRPHFLGGRSASAIRHGDWKLIEFFDTNQSELYDLKRDPSERTNLIAKKPTIAKQLLSKLQTWREKVSARKPSPPLLTEGRQLYFADHFSTGQVSERWHFSKDWFVEKGVLKGRRDRIFLKGAKYRNSIIRFDFRFGDVQDIRLVTGGGGHYNAVVHIRRDHFYLQTALDRSGPYFPYRHGECAFKFDPERWYTMTVEFLGDQLVAHLDHKHLAYAKHPVLDKERLYFAFQVDQPTASIDNVQILQAVKHRDHKKNLKHIQSMSGKHPVKKPLEEQFQIRKKNAHEWLYQRDAKYRRLVKKIDELDARNKKAFPKVFQSHKEFHKAIQQERKRRLKEDARYKELLFATYRADRAIESFLVSLDPEVKKLPDSRRKHTIEKIRQRFQKDARYLKLVRAQQQAQKKLESAYPHLFISNEEFTRRRQKHREAQEKNATFRKMVNERAAAWRAQQTYLFENDTELSRLKRQLENR